MLSPDAMSADRPGSFGSYARVRRVIDLTDVGGMMLFSATDGSRGQELWSLVEGD